MLDAIIRNGIVIDPITKTETKRSLAIADGKFVPLESVKGEIPLEKSIDAEGCLVTPGLIDSHAHLFYGGTENGVSPDSTLLPMGITAAVDQGSAGSATFRAFYDSILARTRMHLFATVNLSTEGLITSRYPENLDPANVDESALTSLFQQYQNILKGIKLRISKEIVGDLGIAPLKKALDIAEKIGTRVVVHTTNPPVATDELLTYFRKEDIYTHVFSQRGYSILSSTGTLLDAVYKARERGVIFDAADARTHYSIPVIQQALKEKFYPDTISTDLIQKTCFRSSVFGLPMEMSKYLALGMPLTEIIRTVTYRAAQALHEEKTIGSFQPGISGDVAIFKLKESRTKMVDRENNTIEIPQLLIPQCTILKGKIVYRQFDF